MSPAEVWLLIDAKIPEKTYGNLKQSEVDEMMAWREEMEAKGVQLA